MKLQKMLTIVSMAVLAYGCSGSHAAFGQIPVNQGRMTTPDKLVLNDTLVYSQGDYKVRFVSNDPDFDTSMRDRLVHTFFDVYPKEVARFNKQSIKTVTFFMDTAYHDIAGTANGIIVFNPDYCRHNPDDLDMVTHEAMHIVQDYPGGPGWITEGIADYARYKYGLHNDQVGWTIQPYCLTVDYHAGYGQAAHFLLWLEAYKNDQIVDSLNSAMHENRYTEAIWSRVTGQSLQELWQAYSQDPVLPEEKVPVFGAVDLNPTSNPKLKVKSRIQVSMENNGGYGAPESSFMLNDNNSKSKFLLRGFQKGFWMQLGLSEPAVANSYILTSANDQPSRDPADWILAGSKDGLNWTQLDKKTSQHFDKRSTTYLFQFNNQSAYLYYRLIIQKTAGSPDFQLSEWRMLYKK